jgi:hypothetical protein
LYTWGSNAYNQLGHHHQRELFTLMRELKQSYPSSPDAKWGYWRVDEPVESEHESESEGQAAERSPVERSQGLEKSRELTGCRLASSTTWLCATPKLVGGPLLNKTIVHVACGAQHMACVTGTLALFLFITLLLPLLSLFQFLFLVASADNHLLYHRRGRRLHMGLWRYFY